MDNYIKTWFTSGQQAIDDGLITEEHWRQAISHPWTWVIISGTLRIREIPWNGLEIDNSPQAVS